MQEEPQFALTPSTGWGTVYKARGANRSRVLLKQQLTQKFAYPYLDHSSGFAWKPIGQRGPARETQTLIVSYPYKDALDRVDYEVFTSAVHQLGLQIVKEDAIDKYCIIIADRDVDIQAAIIQLPPPQ